MKKILLGAALVAMTMGVQAESYSCPGFLISTVYTVVGDDVEGMNTWGQDTPDIFPIVSQDERGIRFDMHEKHPNTEMYISRETGDFSLIKFNSHFDAWACTILESYNGK